ncbi:MAG: hypothetical protein NVSMB51_06580 [Solirubrobacteraceae bacterium]
MSEANIDIVKQVFAAQRAGDMSTIFALYDPEIEWETLAEAPGDRIYKGHEGIRTFFRAWLGGWRDWGLEVEEISALGERQVLTVFRQFGRLRDADVEFENRTSQLWTLHDGKVIAVQDFSSREQALAARETPDRPRSAGRAGARLR